MSLVACLKWVFNNLIVSSAIILLWLILGAPVHCKTLFEFAEWPDLPSLHGPVYLSLVRLGMPSNAMRYSTCIHGGARWSAITIPDLSYRVKYIALWFGSWHFRYWRCFFNQYSSWVAMELLRAGPWVFWALSHEFTRTIGALGLDRVCQTTRVFDAVRVCSFTLHQDIAT